MKPLIAITIVLGLAVAQGASQARCETHAQLTYCLATPEQTVQYLAHAPQGFVPVLFAEEATIDEVQQTDFAGQLAEGSSVLYRNGVVLMLPKNAAQDIGAFAKFLGSPGKSSQKMVICSRMEVGDTCKGQAHGIGFQPWSVALWIADLPSLGATNYYILFRPRDDQEDPKRYTLPGAAFEGECGCEDSELPGIWVLLKQQALAQFR